MVSVRPFVREVTSLIILVTLHPCCDFFLFSAAYKGALTVQLLLRIIDTLRFETFKRVFRHLCNCT